MDVILEASIQVMSEHGYHGTSVRDIAQCAGMTPAALYHHFTSKHEVLATIMDRGIEELLARTGAARQAAGTDPVAALRAIVDVHVACGRERFAVDAEQVGHPHHHAPHLRGE